jgi:hypothetical protein
MDGFDWAAIAFLVLVVGYKVYRYFYNKKEDDSIEEDADSVDNSNSEIEMEKEIKTRELAITVLKDIGAELTDVGEDRIQFEYQGITFLMDIDDDCYFVNIIWPWCHTFNKFDIDEFSRVQRVINTINCYDAVSVFYGISDSDDVVLHMKKNLLFIPQIPHIDSYLRSMLGSFFRTVRTLKLEIEKSRLLENKEGV